MNRTIRSIISISLLTTGVATAQVKDTLRNPTMDIPVALTTKEDLSLNGQYQSVLSKSKTLNGYKLVNPARLSSFWKSLSDTLRTERKQLSQSKSLLSEHKQTIDTLRAQLAGKDNTLASANAKLDEINFLGISFSKSTYSTIVWSLIIILALALAIVIVRSVKFIQEAKYRSGLYEEISEEYQKYKVKANEKEKKLARELQDERNKLDELKNKG
ncbi:protein bicaudal D homolog [Pedobacter sp. MC2016-14]|uniref:protein bicaudal D homolog n=1 Tax=Pedobacter sp. MC2016-14 TaxID=2897327 RepID=UPI001E3EBFE6|nr:protein bicaudal D homolog [Pedobacter sp. MC2016-14]MCD0487993.1 protein bicaudal D homolog [Pedobacter sp. MC2016-14]